MDSSRIDIHRDAAETLERAMHPATDSAELRAITPSWHVRQADYNFLTSQEAAALIQEEGIVIVDYRALQKLWKP